MEDKVVIDGSVSDLFKKATYFFSFRKASKLTRNSEHAGKPLTKWVSRIQVQMKSHFVDPMDPISIIEFLHGFRIACDIDRVQ